MSRNHLVTGHRRTSDEAAPFNQQTQQQQHEPAHHFQQQGQESYSTFQQQHGHSSNNGQQLLALKQRSAWSRFLFFPFTASASSEKDKAQRQRHQQQPLADVLMSTTKISSLAVVALVLLGGLVIGRHSSTATRQPSEIMNLPYHTGAWIWDYNVYHNYNYNSTVTSTTAAAVRSSNGNNLLLTQMASGSLRELSDISSIPNRAYARQWGRDYVQIVCPTISGNYSKKRQRESSSLSQPDWLSRPASCFTKVFVLQWLLERRTTPGATHMAAGTATFSDVTASSRINNNNNTRHNPATNSATIPYDTVALLPPDAIVTDLDYDLELLLPRDKLVAIAGWTDPQRDVSSNDCDDDDDDGSHHDDENGNDDRELLLLAAAARTDVIFFNLRHPHAAKVIQLWSDAATAAAQNHEDDTAMTTPTTCGADAVAIGAGDSLHLLFQVMRSVVHNDLDEFQSMIHGLTQNEQGFIIGGSHDLNKNSNNYNTNRVIKSITPPDPAYCRLSLMLADMTNSRAVLQTTADSVCYRYYPKCEVL